MNCLCNGLVDDCPLCGGAGVSASCSCNGLRWVMKEVAKDRWSAMACQRCRGKVTPRSSFGSGLLAGMERWTFEHLIEHPALCEAAEWLKTIVRRQMGWAVFYAPPGRGKTYLMAATANEALGQGSTVRYALSAALLQELHEAQLGRLEYSYHAAMRRLTGVRLLCLDEFGEYNPTAARDAALRELLVCRSEPGWLPTVMATNLTGDDVARRFEWLVSRFNHEQVREFTLEGVSDLREIRL